LIGFLLFCQGLKSGKQKSRKPIKTRADNEQCVSNTLDRQKVEIVTTNASSD